MSNSAASEEDHQKGINRLGYMDRESPTYTSYLQLDKLLSCQQPVDCGKCTHDQHLFIITHQVYELWFKQIIYELDSVREMFKHKILDEKKMLVINIRLNRIVLIFKSLVEQVAILETMTALDFMEFRSYLQAASGFQSLQFRVLENKFGVSEENRVRYNQQHYRQVFIDTESEQQIRQSEEEPSLQKLLQRWLERTPGLERNDFDFWPQYCHAVDSYIVAEFQRPSETMADPKKRALLLADYHKQKESFETVTNEEKFNYFLQRGDRSFSYKAFQGAMMIAIYRDEPRFSHPFQMLNLIMDIDSLFMKWRHNHVIMVQRMIGSKIGTGGSSGYQYLRSTVSDRYKPFADLFNLSTYLIPREYAPELTGKMRRRLSISDPEKDDESAPPLPHILE